MAKKILVVEDEEFMVEAIRMRLEHEGYEVVAAFDGASGFQKARDEKPDLIILDILMPKMDGFEVCRALRAEEAFAAIPIIFLTAVVRRDILDECRRAGSEHYVRKPYSFPELLKLIRSLLGESQQGRDS